MAEAPGEFSPYQVSYSGRVLGELSDLIARAKTLGRHGPLIDAAKAVDHRLRVYPQFGEPVRDSAVESAQEWIGFVGPLVARYVIYEERRLVWVPVPMTPLPHSGY